VTAPHATVRNKDETIVRKAEDLAKRNATSVRSKEMVVMRHVDSVNIASASLENQITLPKVRTSQQRNSL